jgi:hypothetical protein
MTSVSIVYHSGRKLIAVLSRYYWNIPQTTSSPVVYPSTINNSSGVNSIINRILSVLSRFRILIPVNNYFLRISIIVPIARQIRLRAAFIVHQNAILADRIAMEILDKNVVNFVDKRSGTHGFHHDYSTIAKQ